MNASNLAYIVCIVYTIQDWLIAVSSLLSFIGFYIYSIVWLALSIHKIFHSCNFSAASSCCYCCCFEALKFRRRCAYMCFFRGGVAEIGRGRWFFVSGRKFHSCGKWETHSNAIPLRVFCVYLSHMPPVHERTHKGKEIQKKNIEMIPSTKPGIKSEGLNAYNNMNYEIRIENRHVFA